MTRRSIYIFLALSFVAMLLAMIAGLREYRAMKQGRSTPPPAGVAVPATQRPPVDLALLPHGFVVWSSNRFGNHDILMMTLPDLQVRRLTDNPHAEYFSRISPDGNRVVFARAQRPWVSQRDPASWDVFMLDLETGAEQLVARNGNVPTWSADGRKVYFQRNVTQFVEHNLASGQERVLYEAGRGEVAEGTELQTPMLDANSGRLAVTLRRSMRMTAVLDPEQKIHRIGDGCQLAWNHNGGYLYYIDHGGRKQNALYRVEAATGARTLWLDLPEPYSHEYFPRLANDERWLVIGASAGGHEHDSADYELFLWPVNAPAESAIRLTWHTGNDNWPDIYLYRVP